MPSIRLIKHEAVTDCGNELIAELTPIPQRQIGGNPDIELAAYKLIERLITIFDWGTTLPAGRRDWGRVSAFISA